jgi:hypothetical protein
MAERKVEIKKTAKQTHGVVDHSPLFKKENYTWMIIGAVVIAVGMMVMSGGKSPDPNVFNYKEVYSTTRITIAPILIVLGLVIEVYAIFKRSKTA